MEDRYAHRKKFWNHHDKEEYECPRCGRSKPEVDQFQVHHKDMNPANGQLDNLVALCRDCHHDEHDINPGQNEGHWSEEYFNEWGSKQSPLKYM